jgi:hypothetical protein
MTDMINRKKGRRILWYEGLGFFLIISLSWADEMLNLPYLIFPGPGHSNWREAAMETIVVLTVWLVVFVLTRRLLARLYYLEGFLRVCAWCHKIGHGEEWLPMEQYFERGFHIDTSHGICPACAQKMTSKDDPANS